ncbi:MAG TPA: PASTA domain-containing protein, partial [Gaiellaceae bacterium]|nr:PASTA domain-containing protein [Gaiellaceae bacterium]
SPPSAPTNLNGTVDNGILTLRWDPSTDPSKTTANFVVFGDDQPLQNLGATELQYQVGPYDPAETRAFSVVQTDTSGNTSARSAAIKVVPTLAGLSLDDARASLGAKGFSVGDIQVVDSQTPAGTIVGPTDLVAAAVGAAIPLQVSAGPGGAASKFVFNVVGTRRLVLTQRKFIGIHIASTLATSATGTLVNSRGARIYTWHVTARAGVSIVKLALPVAARKPGIYVLLWKALSGGETINKSMVVQIFRSAKTLKRPTISDVVLAGADLPTQLPATPKHGQRYVASTGDSTFTLTGDPNRHVEVIVVDADQYGLGLVRDLRTCFPTVRLVVLTNSPKTLSRAVAAGATIALSKRTSTVKLAKVVAALGGSAPRATAAVKPKR